MKKSIVLSLFALAGLVSVSAHASCELADQVTVMNQAALSYVKANYPQFANAKAGVTGINWDESAKEGVAVGDVLIELVGKSVIGLIQVKVNDGCLVTDLSISSNIAETNYLSSLSK